MVLTIRLFEDRVVDLYARGEVPGLAHLYIGEEAVAAGATEESQQEQSAALRPGGLPRCRPPSQRRALRPPGR